MLSASDLEAWDDDVRSDAVAALRRAGWHDAARGRAPSFRLSRLLDRFRAGRSLSTRELTELRDGLGA